MAVYRDICVDTINSRLSEDWQSPSQTMPFCYICSSILHEPYIRCAECSVSVEICPSCFAAGGELEPHKNYHQYIVLKCEFPLYDGSTWSADEELVLLDSLLECGLGNWTDISRHLKTRSAQECEKHYMLFYVENPALELPKFNKNVTLASLPCYEYRPMETEEPPRHLPGSSSYRALGGYNAARGDFEVEYDNYAETPVSQLDANMFQEGEPYYKVGTALQIAIVGIYNNRLRERMRRKCVIRDHGLILVRKTLSWLHRYEVTVTRTVAERLLAFMQLMSGIDFDYIMEGLHHMGELRQYILRLQELRENGIVHFHSCRLYRKLLRAREAHQKEQQASPIFDWHTAIIPTPSTNPHNKAPVPNMSSRRPAPPLDIVGLPGYERLSASERTLCSAARLVPESYLEFQRIMVAECKRNNGLKLAQARTLIKIDVNKTRKLYDFLLKESFIHHPS